MRYSGLLVIVLRFTLLIVGSKHFSDVDMVRQNLKNLPNVSQLGPSISSQNHIQMQGVFSGDAGLLANEIRAFTADRFDVATRDSDNGEVIITLRKIKAQ